MNLLKWEKKTWAAIAVIFLIVWKIGGSLIAYFQPLPWLSWQIIILAFSVVFLWLLVKNFDQFQKIYQDSVVKGIWNFVLAVGYCGGFYFAVQYLADPTSNVIPEFLNKPLSKDGRLALAIVAVATGLFILQPILNKVFGKQGMFAWATVRLVVIAVVATSLVSGLGGTYDFRTGESKIYVDPATGDYYFEKGRSPKTSNELLSCTGATGDLKTKCDAAQKDYEHMENAVKAAKKNFLTWLDGVGGPLSKKSSSISTPSFPPVVVKRESSVPSSNKCYRCWGYSAYNHKGCVC